MSELKEFCSPVTLAIELTRRVRNMVTPEDLKRGVDCDPNTLLSWAGGWLEERQPLSDNDTVESLSQELLLDFFTDGGTTTGDGDYQTPKDGSYIIAEVLELGSNWGRLSYYAHRDLAEMVSKEVGGVCDPDRMMFWLSNRYLSQSDTVKTLANAYREMLNKERK
jgi:hypothetical protein